MISSVQEDEKGIVQEIQNLYYKCRIKECIQRVDELDIQRGSVCHQIIQMYKGICFFKSQQINDAFKSFNTLLDENRVKKGNNVDVMDVIIMSLFQLESQYFHIPKAELANSTLLKITEDYKIQNEDKESYHRGFYLFGMGLYQFIESCREGVNPLAFKLLEEAYELLDEFKNEVALTLGWVSYIDTQNLKSEQWYQQLYDLNPCFPSVANNFALLCEQIEDFDKAEKLFLEEEQMRGYNSVIINNMSLFYSEKRNDNEKEKEYQDKLMLLTPKTAKICHFHGEYLNRKGNEEGGKELFKEGIEIDPSYTGNYEELSEILISNDINQSIQLIEQCVQLYPQDGQLYTQLGRRYETSGNLERAVEAYTKSIEFKNYLDYKIYSHRRLHSLYDRLQQYPRAFQELFNCANYKSSKHYTITEAYWKADLYSREQGLVTIKQSTEVINQLNGIVISRFQNFAEYASTNSLKGLYLYKLDSLRTHLFIMVYKREAENFLTFKKDMIFWDLYID